MEQVMCAPLVPIFSLLHKLFKMASLPYLKLGELFHVFMGGTAKEFEGRGLGFKMRQHSLGMARSKGYQAVIVEASNPVTLHIWKNKLGGESLASITLNTFEDEHSERPFNHLNHKVELVVVHLDRSV
eukprot:TRINITY_DN4751_c0_g1_i3.p1 TRINITY_DN4751_c0_g1~~TRINITY_DN4751_c0_g1_i3.p1  ORF type:complete len:128 (-),score=6.07 TRINITY_DN4751_c0_g1_i3:69-452(-)